MSRIAKQPVEIPSGVEINIKNNLISFKGPKGEMSMDVHSSVDINKEDKIINIEVKDNNSTKYPLFNECADTPQVNKKGLIFYS